MALFKKRRKPGPDDLYGTGLWRQHRDRFNRAVDRFYTTAVAVHSETPDSPAAEVLAQQTVRLNELSEMVDTAAQAAQAAYPNDGMVLPAVARGSVGRLPELLSHAALKVAEAAQAAAMTRAVLKMAGTTPVGTPAADIPAGAPPIDTARTDAATLSTPPAPAPPVGTPGVPVGNPGAATPDTQLGNPADSTTPAAPPKPAPAGGSPADSAGVSQADTTGEEPWMAAAASAAKYVDDAYHIVAACTEAARGL